MEKFVVTRELIKKAPKYALKKTLVEFKIKPAPSGLEPIGWVRSAIDDAIVYSTRELSATDKVAFTFSSKDFARGEGWVRFQEAGKVSNKDVWNVLASIYQSNSLSLSTDTFCLGVTSVKMPVGSGKRANCFNSFDEECAKKVGIVSIQNKDNLCLPRALAVAMAFATKDAHYKKVRQNIGKEQSNRATQLIKRAGLVVPETGCGIEELKRFQETLPQFQIMVYQYGTKGRDVIFSGPPAEKKLHLVYNKGHYNVITSLTAAFSCGYYCEECHCPYDHKNKHRCIASCPACSQSPSCSSSVSIRCSDCCRKFRGQLCYDHHLTPSSFEKNQSICQAIRQCNECLQTVRTNRIHNCGEAYCNICQKHSPKGHLCFMRINKSRPELEGFLFIFYDLECRQETQLENKDLLHEPTLCVFKTVCDKCVNSSDSKCPECGERIQISSDFKNNWLQTPPIEWFMNYVLNRRKNHKKVVVVAHNGQAYDHQFILNYTFNKTSLKPTLIMKGSKIIQMNVGNVKFIDSLNFFPMPLSALPKAFGLGDYKKGYFPHLFNVKKNENYFGPFPDMKYFSPDTMKEEVRHKFLEWYESQRNTKFDFNKELVEYCISDVEILTAACLKFRQLMLETGNVCPLTEACTIASVCLLVYRRNFLKANTIGIIPKGGYRATDNHSVIATKWLIWEEFKRNINIGHAAKQAEAVVKGMKVDGLYENIVFEFHGCYYHGCPRCYKHSRDTPYPEDPSTTFNTRYESTLMKTERLKHHGFEVVEMWECDFKRMMKKDPSIKDVTFQHPLVVNTPLNARDAFYGGRTGNCKEVYECKPDEKIKYVDVCSLYPWVCKYGKFPIEHPKVIVGHECSTLDLKECCGLIKCTILPPQDLYHPVLPLKMNDKLMFVLCRTCGEKMSLEECNHSQTERALSGTWVIEEVLKAIEMGYQMLEIQEVWKYNWSMYDPQTRTGGLFTEMMNKFLKYKQQASGWPSDCTTEEEKNAYIKNFQAKEGIEMDFSEIVSNPGLRSQAKLILNSFWGKLGQRENQPQTVIVRTSEEFFKFMSNPAFHINSVLLINEEVVIVNYEHIEEAYKQLSTVNVTLAAYTTAQARLKLYSYLEKLGDRVLYYDTDSVIYISKEGEYDIPTGSMLGEMTDELNGGYIRKFASGGPKNYGYELDNGKMICKVKGISLNHQTSQQINFHSMSQMISDRSDPISIVTNNIMRTEDYKIVTRSQSKIYKPHSSKRKFQDYGSVPYGFKQKKITDTSMDI